MNNKIRQRIARSYPSCNSSVLVPKESPELFNNGMTIYETRYAHFMATLNGRFEESLEKMAAATDSNPKHLSQIKNRVRNIGNKTSARMEGALGLTPGAWDRPIGEGFVTEEGSEGFQKLSELYRSLDPARQARALAMLEAAFGDSLEDSKTGE